ncbi:MAG: hypothetical protein HYZ28_12280 [Myxococcales bacterium]|nr:hypothetical protein [Myxococcales bacterium]
MRNPLGTLVLALALFACSKSKPSPEYAQAMSLHASLYAEKLDDAYWDPRMAEVEALLSKVPESSLDHAAAKDMLERIASGRERVKAEDEQRKKAVAEALKPVPMPPSEPSALPPPAPKAAEAPPDAGPTQPVSGMSAAEFLARFSGCFRQADAVEVTGRGKMDSYELKDIANCRDRHPGFADRVVLLEAGKVYDFVAKSAFRLEWRLPDGGSLDAGG